MGTKTFDEILLSGKKPETISELISSLIEDTEIAETCACNYDKTIIPLKETVDLTKISSYEEIKSAIEDYAEFLDVQFKRIQRTKNRIKTQLDNNKRNWTNPEDKQRFILFLKKYKQLLDHSENIRKKCLSIINIINSIERMMKLHGLITDEDLK